MKRENYLAYFHSVMSHGIIQKHSTDTMKKVHSQKNNGRGYKEESLVGT